MKYCVLGAIAIAASVILSCDGGGGYRPPPPPPAYIGAWVYPPWNGRGADPPAKIVFGEDSVAFYENDTDEIPLLSGRFDLVEKSSSVFKGVMSFTEGTMYGLLRVSNRDSTLELDFGISGFPARIDPADNNFSAFTRQGTVPSEMGWIFYWGWVNPEYNGGHGVSGPPGKFKMSADSFASYDNDYDEDDAPMSTGVLSVHDEWISTGFHYFNGDMTITTGVGNGTHAFFLIRVSNSNGTMEMGTSDTEYPTTVGITYDHQ
jgi:hypothetical protein